MRNDFRQLKFKLFLQIAATAAATSLMGLLIKKFFRDGLLRSPFSENFVRFCEKVFHMTHPAALQLYQDLFQKNRDILFMVVYIGLLLLMITLTISRVTRYFDEVSRAMDGLLTEDSTPIHLSSELAAVEDRINGVKVTLLQKRREALEAEQRKNDLVVYLAHDIKTPLTSVIGYLELLESSAELSEAERDRYTAVALEKAHRLEQLIGEFFDITRFHLQEQPLSRDKIDLSLMLCQLADEFYPVLESRQMRAEVSGEHDLWLLGDANLLARAFNNLLKNAVSYGRDGSVIRISVTRAGAYGARVIFANEGDPIPPDKLKTIFEKFVRLDDARSGNTGGAGLGLAIAKEIIARHGGVISAESDAESTRFIILLPASPPRHSLNKK